MCRLELIALLENAFIALSPFISAAANKIRALKCKFAALMYNPNSTVVIDLPIECSINDIFSDVFMDMNAEMDYEEQEFDPLVTTEYKQFIMTGVPPEIYYFFRYYDSQSGELFRNLCVYWGYTPKSTYVMSDVDGNIIALYTNGDEIKGKYCDKLN